MLVPFSLTCESDDFGIALLIIDEILTKQDWGETPYAFKLDLTWKGLIRPRYYDIANKRRQGEVSCQLRIMTYGHISSRKQCSSYKCYQASWNYRLRTK
jgi:hypothetical protein